MNAQAYEKPRTYMLFVKKRIPERCVFTGPDGRKRACQFWEKPDTAFIELADFDENGNLIFLGIGIDRGRCSHFYRSIRNNYRPCKECLDTREAWQ
jgi:hypothetical protein